MDSKAQLSAEFLLLLGLVFFIVIGVIALSFNNLKDFQLKKEDEVVKDVALKLQKELLIAASVEDGYIRYFTMTDKIENIDYSLITQNSSIGVLSKNSIYIVRIPSSIGNVTKGVNKINKTRGVIYIN